MVGITGKNPLAIKRRQQALRVWCDETWPGLYRYIYRRVQNREEAEELTQETYARILPIFSGQDDFPSPGYLQTVALNLIRDRWRRQRLHGISIPLEENLLINNDNEEEVALNRTLVVDLMNKLSEEQRMVLQLRIIEGYSRLETAQKLGRSEDSIRGLQYRAVQALRSLALEDIKGVEH